MKLIPLKKWAALHLPDTKISNQTLSRYAREQRFNPPAKIIGRAWHVDENAEYNDTPRQSTSTFRPVSTDPIVNSIFNS